MLPPAGGQPACSPAKDSPAVTRISSPPGNIAEPLWAALAAHEPTRRRYQARVYQRGPGQCWYWLGAISDTGHGKLRAGTRSSAGGEPASRVVTAHVYGWHLTHGPPAALPRTGAPLIAHRCDEASCQNPACWRLDDTAGNAADYLARRARTDSPLADSRGPDGRARAIAQAIKTALRDGTDPEAAIARAAAVGIRGVQSPLW